MKPQIEKQDQDINSKSTSNDLNKTIPKLKKKEFDMNLVKHVKKQKKQKQSFNKRALVPRQHPTRQHPKRQFDMNEVKAVKNDLPEMKINNTNHKNTNDPTTNVDQNNIPNQQIQAASNQMIKPIQQEQKQVNQKGNDSQIIQDKQDKLQLEGTSKETKDNQFNSDENKNSPRNTQNLIQNDQNIEQNQLDLNKNKDIIRDDSSDRDSLPKQPDKPQQNSLLLEYLDHCDYIELQSNNGNPKIYFVLSKFAVYIGKFNKETSSKEGNGLILQRYFDKDFNSQYFQYQGEFRNDQIVGRGQLFQHKSKRVIQEGEWSSIQKTLNQQPNIAIKPRISKIKILNVANLQDGVQRKRVFNSKETTAFHDQLLNLNDLTILINKAWLNSSIIDAYVDHLNYEDELHYWTLKVEDRRLYKRLQIIPSWLFSWFHKGQDPINLEYFQQIYAQYEPIGFKIWKIYKKIGFIINKSNVHWYFVQLDFEKMEILILDSMRGSEQAYQSTVDILQKLFEQIDQSVKFTVKVSQDCEQQRNGYDCGAYTCINAKKLADDNSGKNLNGLDMRQLLLDFIQYQRNE